jgi:predicted amino acid-binding ACT domain protein
LAAVFMAVGLAHLFVSLVGHHADGATMLVISGVTLIAGAGVHRWWGVRRHAAGRPGPTGLPGLPGAGTSMWRVRATLRDRPGSLAALTGKLSALNVNILAIQVHPTREGVADELLVAAPPGVTIKEIAAAVDAGGGVGIAVASADARALVDPPTRALNLAARAAADTRCLPEVLAELLGAVVVEPATAGGDGEDATTAWVRDQAGAHVALSRPGMPFTPAELSRARALVDLCALSGPCGAHR